MTHCCAHIFRDLKFMGVCQQFWKVLWMMNASHIHWFEQDETNKMFRNSDTEEFFFFPGFRCSCRKPGRIPPAETKLAVYRRLLVTVEQFQYLISWNIYVGFNVVRGALRPSYKFLKSLIPSSATTLVNLYNLGTNIFKKNAVVPAHAGHNEYHFKCAST